jgi:hypothetical protein
MYYTIKINPSTILTTLTTILTVLEDKLNEINYKSLYSVNGYRSGALEYVVQAEKSTSADAVTVCTNQNLKLFTIKPGLDLATFFTRYDITQA